MTQDKMRRIVTACVSVCTALIVILSLWLIGQWIYINQLENKEKKLLSEIAYHESVLENTTDMLEYYESEYYLQKAYRELMEIKGDKK